MHRSEPYKESNVPEQDKPNSVPTVDSPHDLRQSGETPRDSSSNQVDQAKVNREATEARDAATGKDKRA